MINLIPMKKFYFMTISKAKNINKIIIIIIVCMLSGFPINSNKILANEYIRTNTNNNATNIYKTNVNSMVYIETQENVGSGVIVRQDGTFLTCFHVIANADYIKVKLNDGSIYYVNGFRYVNPLTDIAILTLDAQRTFRPIKINNLNSIEIGEKVYTLSNPKGIQFVFTDGMINQFSKENIQFSAPVAEGSSGGALLNEQGSLLGIITSLLRNAQNINFALPNEYYLSKIGNKAIYNTKKLRWTSFLVDNANYEQFKLYSEYALSKSNYEMLYKYLKPFSLREDMPVKYCPLLGYLALASFLTKGKKQYLYESQIFYEKAYRNNVKDEGTLLALILLYMITDDKRTNLHEEIIDRLYDYYPNSYNKLTELSEKAYACKSESCYIEVGVDYLDYLINVTSVSY